MTIYPMQGAGPYYTNCYLTIGETPGADGTLPAVLVDASVTPQAASRQLQKSNASLGAILLTHGHADHRETLDALRAAFAVPVFLAAADARQFTIADTRPYTDAPVRVGDLCLQPTATPGHTPGSVCLVCGQVLFCGDTLFAGSAGRTDLAGGDGAQLCRSLRKIAETMDEELQVLPGHGEFSTLKEEKLHNPYLRMAMTDPEAVF